MGMRPLEFWEGGEIDTILGYLVLFACNTSVTDECCDKLFGVAPPFGHECTTTKHTQKNTVSMTRRVATIK